MWYYRLVYKSFSNLISGFCLLLKQQSSSWKTFCICSVQAERTKNYSEVLLAKAVICSHSQDNNLQVEKRSVFAVSKLNTRRNLETSIRDLFRTSFGKSSDLFSLSRQQYPSWKTFCVSSVQAEHKKKPWNFDQRSIQKFLWQKQWSALTLKTAIFKLKTDLYLQCASWTHEEILQFLTETKTKSSSQTSLPFQLNYSCHSIPEVSRPSLTRIFKHDCQLDHAR